MTPPSSSSPSPPLIWFIPFPLAQDHLVGWNIEAQQYTSGAIVRGQVQSCTPTLGRQSESLSSPLHLRPTCCFLIDDAFSNLPIVRSGRGEAVLR